MLYMGLIMLWLKLSNELRPSNSNPSTLPFDVTLRNIAACVIALCSEA